MGRVDPRVRSLAIVNLLTLSRLAAGLASLPVALARHEVLLLGALFGYVLASDIADGALSRRWRVSTLAGSVFDYVVDRFNTYLQICILIYFSVPIYVFVPYLLRDLVYVLGQSYLAVGRLSGMKGLSVPATVGTYAYVIWLSAAQRSEALEVLLLFAYIVSLAGLLTRLYRMRDVFLARLKGEMSL
jgi:phosphatidylglycerophosphate synthase